MATLNINDVVVRPLTNYHTNIPIPRNGFKCLVLDGIKYLIDVLHGEVINVYDTKQKFNKNTPVNRQPLFDKSIKNMRDKLNDIFKHESIRLNSNQYVFEIIYSNKGVTITDVLYETKHPMLRTTTYQNRIAHLHDIFTKTLPRLRTVDEKAVFNIDINSIHTPTVLRQMSSFLDLGKDYLVTPAKDNNTYMIVGSAQLLKQNIILKREPFLSTSSLSMPIKKILTSEDESVITEIATKANDEQLLFYNNLKNSLFSQHPELAPDEHLVYPNPQLQFVNLIAGLENENLVIFGYAKPDAVINSENKVFAPQAERVKWAEAKFASLFEDVQFFKEFYQVVCRHNTKFVKGRLSNLTILSVLSFCNNNAINTANVDDIPVIEKNRLINSSLRTASNDDIIYECIRRIANLYTETKLCEHKYILENLKRIVKIDNEKIYENITNLIEMLRAEDDVNYESTIEMLIEQLSNVNHDEANLLLCDCMRNKRKIKRDCDDRKNAKRIKYTRHMDSSSSDDN